MSILLPSVQQDKSAASTGGAQARLSGAPLLVSGVDKLEISLYLEIGNAEIFSRFARFKKELQSGFADSLPVDFLQGDYFSFNMKRMGTRFFPYVFQSGDVRLMLSSRGPDSKLPNCQIEIGSVSCQQDFYRIYHELINWLKSYNFTVKKEVVSRVDLATDFIDVDIRQLDIDNKHKWISKARKFAIYNEGWEVTGIMIGRGNFVMRIYDKTTELKKNQEKGNFFRTVWGCDEDTPVTRVEIQVRREALKEFAIPLDTVQDLKAHADSLWKYATDEWARFAAHNVDRDNRNQDKARMSMFWRMVQDVNFVLPVKCDLKNFRYKKNLHKNLRQLRDMARGCMMSIAAAAGHTVDDFFGILATCVDVMSEDMAGFMSDRQVDFLKLFTQRRNECYIGF